MGGGLEYKTGEEVMIERMFLLRPVLTQSPGESALDDAKGCHPARVSLTWNPVQTAMRRRAPDRPGLSGSYPTGIHLPADLI